MPALLLSIRDTGVGMDASTLGRIFDPFFTSKETGVGTGLGLAMAYNIIKQHKGVIEVHSTPNVGTTFNIFLPKNENQIFPPPPETARMIWSKGSGSILVIDDEEIVRTTTRELLEALGYQVLLAASGDEGIQLFKNNRETIKAILLDMAMPKKSGKEVFIELKQIDENIKVVLSSGFRHDRRVEETMALGVQEFIQKPYSMEQLMKTMGKVIETGEENHDDT
jgi:CheY-like chemotaxis protein